MTNQNTPQPTTRIGRYIVHRLWTMRNDEDRTTGYYILDLETMTENTSHTHKIRIFKEDCGNNYKYLSNVTRYPAHSGHIVHKFVEELNMQHKITMFVEDLKRVEGLKESL